MKRRFNKAYYRALDEFEKRREQVLAEELTKDKVLEIRERRTAARAIAYEARKASQPKRPETVPVLNRSRDARLELKESVLTYYGPQSKLGCRWEECKVVDLDMLTLDHINDDGARHILPGYNQRLTGNALYRWAKMNTYPEGLQTLCANHQLKKQILKLRAESNKFYD